MVNPYPTSPLVIVRLFGRRYNGQSGYFGTTGYRYCYLCDEIEKEIKGGKEMRKLTPLQQEIIDLMKDGWELGTAMGLNPRSWLQKGGLGKGGESKEIKSGTVHALAYLGYIERGESEFPTLHYRLKTEKPTTDVTLEENDSLQGDRFKHPSFGTISFTRTQGSHSQALFGSSIKHNHAILVRISHAEKHRSTAHDYIFSRGPIIEAYMSPTQFADALTGHGSGGESPITLQFTEKDGDIEQPSFENKRLQFEKDFFKRAEDIVKQINETIEKAKDKKAPQWLVHDMEITKSWLKSNIPFLAEQFAEQMDKTVTEAKAEVEAYVTSVIQQTGLEALEDMKPQITEGNK